MAGGEAALRRLFSRPSPVGPGLRRAGEWRRIPALPNRKKLADIAGEGADIDSYGFRKGAVSRVNPVRHERGAKSV